MLDPSSNDDRTNGPRGTEKCKAKDHRKIRKNSREIKRRKRRNS